MELKVFNAVAKALAVGAVAVFAAAAHAETETVGGLRWTYEVDEGEAKLINWNGEALNPVIPATTSGAVTIPSTLGGYRVTIIGRCAFEGCDRLTSVTIPSSVTYIDVAAFMDCKALKTVTIPDSVATIENQAFQGCAALADKDGFVIVRDTVYDYFGSAKNPVVPAGIVRIGSFAFDNCLSMTSVTLPASLERIEGYAFDYCYYLKSLTIPANVTFIGEWTFHKCEDLKSVTYLGSCPDTWEGEIYAEASADLVSIVPATSSSATGTGWENYLGMGVWQDRPIRAAGETYIVRLHRNNSARDGATAGRTYTIGKARALPKIQTELKWAPRKGYDFLGWARTADATTAQYTDGASLGNLSRTPGATVHLYGVWKPHKYIVRLHRNNSKNDGATTGRAFDYDQVRFLPTMAELKWVRSGYMFLGWSQAQSSSTVKYADGLNVFNLSPNDGEELHVWGVWKKAEANAYLLRLHRNNSERDGATAGRQLKLNTNRKLPTVRELGWARTDATFKGWATTARNAAAGKVAYKDGATVKNLVKTPGDTAHIYAVWR